MNIYIQCLCLSGYIFKEVMSREHILLAKKAGGGRSITELWYTTAYSNNSTDTFNLYEIFENGDFRSEKIDHWSIDPPDRIYMELFNDFFDRLFGIEFDSRDATMDVWSWFNTSRIIGSSTILFRQPVEISSSEQFEVFVNPQNDYDKAWFAVYNGTTQPMTDELPLFLFTRNYTTPYPLPLDIDDTAYHGCHNYVTIIPVTAPDAETCLTECGDRGYPHALLGYNCACHCGDVADSITQFNAQCSIQQGTYKCATVIGMFATYTAVQGQSSEEFLPMTYSLWQSIPVYLIPGQNSSFVNFTHFLPDPNPAYVTAMSISSTVVMSLNIGYSSAFQCFNVTVYDTLFNGTREMDIITDGTLYEIPVIPMYCIKLLFPNPVVPVNGTLNIYTFNRNFIQATYLVITGDWEPEEETTTEAQTTTFEVTEADSTIITSDPFLSTDEATASTTYSQSSTSDVTEVETTSLTSDSLSSTDTTGSFSTGITPEFTTTTLSSTVANVSHPDDCDCKCDVIINLDTEISPELQQKMDDMKSSLTVEKDALSSYTRKKTSAKDDRPSSRGIGSIGIIFLTVVLALIVSIDVINFYDILRQCPTRFKSKVPRTKL